MTGPVVAGLIAAVLVATAIIMTTSRFARGPRIGWIAEEPVTRLPWASQHFRSSLPVHGSA